MVSTSNSFYMLSDSDVLVIKIILVMVSLFNNHFSFYLVIVMQQIGTN